MEAPGPNPDQPPRHGASERDAPRRGDHRQGERAKAVAVSSGGGIGAPTLGQRQRHQPGDRDGEVQLAGDRLDPGEGAGQGRGRGDVAVAHRGQGDEGQVGVPRHAERRPGGVRRKAERARRDRVQGLVDLGPRETDQQVDADGADDAIPDRTIRAHRARIGAPDDEPGEESHARARRDRQVPDPRAQIENAQQDRADADDGRDPAPPPVLAQVPDRGDDHERL